MIVKLLLLLTIVVVPIFVRSPWPLNTEFEFGEDLGECMSKDMGIVRFDCPREIRVPQFWTAWWTNGEPGVCQPGLLTAQPEMRLAPKYVDPIRVHNGNSSLMWFTFWRCQHTGLIQWWSLGDARTFVDVSASAYIQIWFSNCSTKPHDPPLDYDCKTPYDADLKVRIGLDPLGASTPASPYIAWSDWTACYGQFCQIETPIVSAYRTVSIVIEAQHFRPDMTAGWPAKHNNVYIDDVAIVIH